MGWMLATIAMVEYPMKPMEQEIKNSNGEILD